MAKTKIQVKSKPVKIERFNIERHHQVGYDAAVKDWATEDEAFLRGMKNVIAEMSFKLNEVIDFINKL